MKKRKKFHHKNIKTSNKLHKLHKKIHKIHKKRKKKKFSLTFNFGNQPNKIAESKKPQKELKFPEKETKPIDKKPSKKKINIGRILFEFLFWFGLGVIIASFLLQLKFYYNIVGLILMIGSLVQYFISQKKSTKLKKEELLKPKLEIKKEPIKKELKGEEIAQKEAKKNKVKKINLISFIILLISGIIYLMQKFNLLSNFYGIAVLVIILFVALMVTLQNRKRSETKNKKGLASKPNPEIEKALKSLKAPDTEIDLLLNYINLKKSVLISTAAKDFGVTRDKVEEWAKILESHDLVRVYYPAIGDASLRPVEEHKKEENGS